MARTDESRGDAMAKSVHTPIGYETIDVRFKVEDGEDFVAIVEGETWCRIHKYHLMQSKSEFRWYDTFEHRSYYGNDKRGRWVEAMLHAFAKAWYQSN